MDPQAQQPAPSSTGTRIDPAELQRRAGNLIRALEAAGVDQPGIVATLREATRLLNVLPPAVTTEQQRALELVRAHTGGSAPAGDTAVIFREALRLAQANGSASATEAGRLLFEERKAGARK